MLSSRASHQSQFLLNFVTFRISCHQTDDPNTPAEARHINHKINRLYEEDANNLTLRYLVGKKMIYLFMIERYLIPHISILKLSILLNGKVSYDICRNRNGLPLNSK